MPINITRTGTYYSVKEMAALRGVSRETIQKWITAGLPAAKFDGHSSYMIHEDDLMAWQPAPVGKPKAKAVNEAALGGL